MTKTQGHLLDEVYMVRISGNKQIQPSDRHPKREVNPQLRALSKRVQEVTNPALERLSGRLRAEIQHKFEEKSPKPKQSKLIAKAAAKTLKI